MIKVIAKYEDSKFGSEVKEQIVAALSATPETHNGMSLWTVEESSEGVLTINFGISVDNKDVVIDLGLVNLIERNKMPEVELGTLETVEDELNKAEATEVTSTPDKTNEIIEQTLEQFESCVKESEVTSTIDASEIPTEEPESAEELPTLTTKEHEVTSE